MSTSPLDLITAHAAAKADDGYYLARAERSEVTNHMLAGRAMDDPASPAWALRNITAGRPPELLRQLARLADVASGRSATPSPQKRAQSNRIVTPYPDEPAERRSVCTRCGTLAPDDALVNGAHKYEGCRGPSGTWPIVRTDIH
ncbi:hypothetical protein GCM10027053_03880 [Intrasporangium mesophilum]